jgi:hypothetical protein
MKPLRQEDYQAMAEENRRLRAELQRYKEPKQDPWVPEMPDSVLAAAVICGLGTAVVYLAFLVAMCAH